MSRSMFFSKSHKAGSSSSIESPQSCLQLSFSEIQLATQNFDESLVIGRGGFGKVYKGTITNGDNLLTAAVKRLDSTSAQGAQEFWAEVKMLSRLRHNNLVSLIGYCNDEKEMILVYDYMPCGTLEDHLHKRLDSLLWVRRLKICIGAARGLDYLHTGTRIKHKHRIIHRDVKSSNILLDDDWEAKISDFGLSRIGPMNQPSSYVSTAVKGTFGYLDPDYFQTGRLTRKSDVYAFGVVLFEVLCGKRAIDRSIDKEQWSLARWAQEAFREGRINQIVDASISGRISPKCLKYFSQLADRCLHIHPKQRPTMAEVVAGLEYVLAIQEKANSTLQHEGMTIFGRMVSMNTFSSNGENSDGDRNLRSLELHRETIQGEEQIVRWFDFDTICVATNNFSEATKFSYDIFISVYKGRLQNGQDVAICGTSSSIKIKYYMHEVSILLRLEHTNLVKLIGYCIEESKVFLIYEFAQQSSLYCLLFDPTCTLLDWNKRYKIIAGVARVLAYLHNHAPIRIIHGNVKPGNVLLDENFDPKLSGFGLATAVNESDCIHADAVRGSLGYFAPEYLTKLQLSTKADVFSFGILVLETITGRRSFDSSIGADMHLVEYIWENWSKGTLSNVIDPRIIGVDLSLITKFLEIGLSCVQENAADRPTMEEVVGMLLEVTYLTLHVLKMRARMSIEHSKYIKPGTSDYDTSVIEDYGSNLYYDCIS